MSSQQGPIIDIAYAPTPSVLKVMSNEEIADNARRFVASVAEEELRERMKLLRTPPKGKEEEDDEEEDTEEEEDEEPFLPFAFWVALGAGIVIGATLTFLLLSYK